MYVSAMNKKEAASFTRNIPRVKHDRKDAILNVEEISLDEYLEGREIHDKMNYYNSSCIQQQRMCIEEIEENIFEEDYEEESKFNNMKKKHNLNNIYNDDPLFEEVKCFREWDVA